MSISDQNESGWEQIQRMNKTTNEMMQAAGKAPGVIAGLWRLAFMLTTFTVFPIIHYRIGARQVLWGFPSFFILNGVSLQFTGGYAGAMVQLWGLVLLAAVLGQIVAMIRRIIVPPHEAIYSRSVGELAPPLRKILEKVFRGWLYRPHVDLIVIVPLVLLFFTLVVWLAEQWDMAQGTEAPGGAWIVPLIATIGVCLLGVQILSEERKARAEFSDQQILQEQQAGIANRQTRADEPRDIEGFVEDDG